MPINLGLAISKISGIGPRRATILQKRGISTLRDLLYSFPRTYKNLLKPQKVSDLVAGEEAVINAEIISIASNRLFRRQMTVTNATAQDRSGIISIVWFNQPFITSVIKNGESYLFYGKVGRNRKIGSLQLVSPKYERTISIVPIYPEIEGLSSKQIRLVMSAVLNNLHAVNDNLPIRIRKKYDLIPLAQALKQIHKPKDQHSLDEARRRLAFDELFSVVTKFKDFENDLTHHRAPSINIDEMKLKQFVSHLPYKLTDEQRIASWRILKHMAPITNHPPASLREALRAGISQITPLNALLNGDVGSGKTVVALMASLNVIYAGYNVVWLAPTQILARQHFETVSRLLASANIDIKLVTANTNVSSRPRVRAEGPLSNEIASLPDGIVNARNDKAFCVHPRSNQRPSASIIIGTHALLHRQDQLHNIGLVVVDEQHRFGVDQRRALLSDDVKTKLAPHFLSMTATPIPRSLAMMLGGMTELVTIKTKPVGRKNIITKVVDDTSRKSMYERIESQIARGHQVYVIAPLVDEGEKARKTLFGDEKKAATREFDTLKKIFPRRRIGLLHGKMKVAEKDNIMKQMLSSRIDILVSTTVVEVGVDVPNATVMVIENANYFGLAQLHQLRGRVGRSNHQSYCYLSITGDVGQIARERLSIMERTNDGFIIAQKDLELRGPGTIVGTQQAGFFDLRLASLGDTILIEQVKEAVALLNPN